MLSFSPPFVDARPAAGRLMGILVAFAFLLSGCDDPSNVGQGLLDAQSNDTEVIRLEDGGVSASDRGDLTGGNSVIWSTRDVFGQVN
ncbi:MAG: hypothetical protein OXT73_07300, partial [Bacteroidota bacterium]|nr:hypothetical protein [Bacteroidota bacterium]